MLAAYFDDSGNYRGPRGGGTHALAFVGFVSMQEQWKRFDPEWRHILGMPQFDLDYPT